MKTPKTKIEQKNPPIFTIPYGCGGMHYSISPSQTTGTNSCPTITTYNGGPASTTTNVTICSPDSLYDQARIGWQDWNQYDHWRDDLWQQGTSVTQPPHIIQVNPQPFLCRFACYPTSEDRISPAKREIIFKILGLTKLTYESLVKHLEIDLMLFNTLLMEYALQRRPRLFMQLFSRNSQFTPIELFTEVVGKIYE